MWRSLSSLNASCWIYLLSMYSAIQIWKLHKINWFVMSCSNFKFIEASCPLGLASLKYQVYLPIWRSIWPGYSNRQLERWQGNDKLASCRKQWHWSSHFDLYLLRIQRQLTLVPYIWQYQDWQLPLWRISACCVFMNREHEKQEAVRERTHLHVCDLWPCGVTLTFRQGQESWCH